MGGRSFVRAKEFESRQKNHENAALQILVSCPLRSGKNGRSRLWSQNDAKRPLCLLMAFLGSQLQISVRKAALV
jgi:hypothetical protein